MFQKTFVIKKTFILEPWGEIYPMEPQTNFIVSFRSPIAPFSPHNVEVAYGIDHITVYAWEGCTATLFQNGEEVGAGAAPRSCVPQGLEAIKTTVFFQDTINGVHEFKARRAMLAMKLVFTLQKPSPDYWIAALSDDSQEALITASSVPEPSLVPLLWAVRLLLMGASDAKCSWWNEPGEYRWLFTRQGEQVVIHIIWFRGIAGWSDDKGETVLRITCDLLSFAKRLLHQSGQLKHRDGDLTVPADEYRKLQEAIQAFEQTNRRLQA